MKTMSIRMNSGEEIIGVVVEGLSPIPTTPSGTITLKKVRSINLQPMGNNQLGIAFMPYVVGSDGELTFILDNCAQTIYEPTTDIENGYFQQTSGITIARPGVEI